MIVAAIAHGSEAYDYAALVKLARSSLQVFEASRVVTGVWQGFDMALAEAAIELRIPVTVIQSYIHPSFKDSNDLRERKIRIISRSDQYRCLVFNNRTDTAVRDGNRFRVGRSNTLFTLCYRPSGTIDEAKARGLFVFDCMPLLAANA